MRWKIAIMTALLCMAIIGIACADYTTPDGLVVYEDSYIGTVSIQGYKGNGGRVVIPGSINGKPVTGVNLYNYSESRGFTEITSLDVSQCTSLQTLYCPGLGITALDVSKCVQLESLNCSGAAITTLDVSHNAKLDRLVCDDTAITALDVRQNAALTALYVRNTALTSVDVSQNPQLKELYVDGTGITTLDVSRNPYLANLSFAHTAIGHLDLSQNTSLTAINCSYTPLTAIDVSRFTGLYYLQCDHSALTSLDLSAFKRISYVDVSGCSLAINCPDGQFDLTTLPGAFDITRASRWKGGTVQGNILSISGDTTVTYDYSCGASKTVTFTLICKVTDASAIPGDIDGNGVVDLADVTAAAAAQRWADAADTLKLLCGW